MSSLRDAALARSRERRRKAVPTPFGEVEVRSLRGSEFDEIGDRQKDAPASVQNALLVVACCFDPATGERVFGWDDAAALAAGDLGLVLDLAAAIDDLNGLSERARGKPSSTPGAGTGSGSPGPSASPPTS